MQLESRLQSTYPRGAVRRGVGDDSSVALEHIFLNARADLYKIALRVTGNPADAEDALQDGLLSAFRNLNRFEGRSQFSTWLTRIILNSALMRLRQNRTRRTISIDQSPEQGAQPFAGTFPDPRPNPEEICARQEQIENLERALKAMPRGYHQAVQLRHVQGMKIKEAADALGVSAGTLKSRLFRARQWLNEEAPQLRP